MSGASLILSRRTRHSSAFLSTAPTRFRAALTMLGFMLCAFRTASITDFCAHPTDVLGVLRTSAYKRCRRPADFGTVPIKSDALGHHGDILFTQAGIRTMLAFLRTLQAGLDTGLVLFVGHLRLSFEKKNNPRRYGIPYAPSDSQPLCHTDLFFRRLFCAVPNLFREALRRLATGC